MKFYFIILKILTNSVAVFFNVLSFLPRKKHARPAEQKEIMLFPLVVRYIPLAPQYGTPKNPTLFTRSLISAPHSVSSLAERVPDAKLSKQLEFVSLPFF
jgi:hypothetical protein